MSDAAPQELTIDVSRPLEGVVLVVLTGEMDIVSSADYTGRLGDLPVDGPVHVVVDLEGLSFVDSIGINALVQSVRSLESRHCTAVLAAPGPAARRVFEIARVAEVVPVEETRAEALDRRLAPVESDHPFADDVR